jgi:hypothetical protein
MPRLTLSLFETELQTCPTVRTHGECHLEWRMYDVCAVSMIGSITFFELLKVLHPEKSRKEIREMIVRTKRMHASLASKNMSVRVCVCVCVRACVRAFILELPTS